MIDITEKAADEVRRILSEQNLPDETALRVGVKGGGCSGFSYTLGFILYSIALGMSAVTTELWQLIATRVFMGFGSAMILAGVNAIIVDRFDRKERAKAIGIAGAVVGLGLSIGPLAGGWLLDELGWQALASVATSIAPKTAPGGCDPAEGTSLM